MGGGAGAAVGSAANCAGGNAGDIGGGDETIADSDSSTALPLPLSTFGAGASGGDFSASDPASKTVSLALGGSSEAALALR